MSEYIVRYAASKKLYPKEILIFALDYYKSLESGEDDFSRKLIYFYKYGNNLDYFLENLLQLFTLRFKDDAIKFDLVTIYPTHKKDSLNLNMISLIESFSKNSGLQYNQIIRRIKTIKSNHECKSFEERKENVKDSIEITGDVKGKNIILVDNTSTTGISLIDATNLLYEKGVNMVVCVCLGLSEKEKEKDWKDINKTLKYSKILTFCKSPFISEEERKKWKMKK
ncbi:hypothetical protein GOV04_03555 [Candidatus Woesearchaeota archaeon]|nr:hypothetical protein [Candidatus Woesearchaeota archaeon]